MAVWALNVKMTDPLVVTAESALRKSPHGTSRELQRTSGTHFSSVLPGNVGDGEKHRVGSEHCSVFGKQCSVFGCSEFVFGSEHCLNTPSEHFFISKKGGGAEGAAPFFDL